MWNKSIIALTVLSILACIGQFAYWTPQLPDPMPMHFDFQGNPDAWTGSGQFVILIALLLTLCVGVMFFLLWLLDKLPPSMINIPNRDYWLAGDRHASTIAWSRNMMLLVITGIIWLFMGIFQLSVSVGLGKRVSTSPDIWIMIAIFMLACFAIVIYSSYRFRLPSMEK